MTSESEKLLRCRLNDLLFGCNLQEFSRQTENLSKLLATQQISQFEAERQINRLWRKFEGSVKQLEIESYEDGQS
jgi:hypothetical protein